MTTDRLPPAYRCAIGDGPYFALRRTTDDACLSTTPRVCQDLDGMDEKVWRRGVSFPIGAAASLEELDLDPHPLLARLREGEPVSWLPALGGWLVTRRDLALQAMRASATFTVTIPVSPPGGSWARACSRGT